MSRKQRNTAITNWNEKCGKIDAARERRGLNPEDGADPEGLATLAIASGLGETLASDVEAPFVDESCPAMPTAVTTQLGSFAMAAQEHRDKDVDRYSSAQGDGREIGPD